MSKYPSLWKNKNECHKLTTVRDNDWNEILFDLKETFGRACLVKHGMDTVKGLKSVWASLRGYYMSLERKRKGSSGASAEGNFYLAMLQFCVMFYYHQKKNSITDVRIPPWPFYASMHFLRESLVCLPTKSSLDVGANTSEDNVSTSGRIAKWSPREAKNKKMMNERFILAMENIGGKISENSGDSNCSKKEDGSDVDPFFLWLAAEYKKMEPEKQKAFKRDVTMTMHNHM